MNRAHHKILGAIIVAIGLFAGREAEAQLTVPASGGTRRAERIRVLSLQWTPRAVEAPRPRTLPEKAARLVTDLATLQREGGLGLWSVPPYITESNVLDWMPEVRVNPPPPGERVVARRQPVIGLGLLQITSTTTLTATGRGHDAVLVGLQVTLPWRLP